MPEVEDLKPMSIETALTEVQIAVPSSDAEAGRAARAVRERIRALGGSETPFRDQGEMGDLSTHVIALGNLGNNALIASLYEQWYTMVDGRYPGRGGYVLQSVHNPWGNGRNVLIVGASDGDGMQRGAQALIRRLDRGLALGHVLEVVFGSDLLREQRILAQWAEETPDEEWGFGLEGEGIAHAGLYYLATGDERFGQRYREGMLAMAAAAPEVVRERQVHLTFYQKMILWDILEESPVFSNEDRLRITQYALRVLRSEQGYGNEGFHRHLRIRAPRQNHQTLLAMALFFGGRYFQKYYGLSEAEDWLRDVRTLFQEYDSHSKPVCDCNFHGWACTLENVASHALIDPQSRFFFSGMAREAADRGIISCDNRGYMPCLGDYSTDSGYPTSLFQKAAYYYKDGRYAFMVAKRRAGFGDNGLPFREGRHMADELGRGFDGVEPVEPRDMIGIKVARLDELYYRMPAHDPEGARRLFVQPPNVAHRKTFDKMSFRTGFDPVDQYLLFDGVGGGSHSYEDMNSVVEFAQHGKSWIVTEDSGMWPNFRDHNVVTVVRDGAGDIPPTFAGMDFADDLAELGFTRTYLRRYNGVNWHRNIFWKKGAYFLVIDELKALQSGEYTLECRWKVVGDHALSGRKLTVRQDAFSCVVSNADSSRLWTEPVNFGLWFEWHAPRRKMRERFYEREDLTAQQLHESVVQKMRRGDRYAFLNLIAADKGTPDYELTRVDDTAVLISGQGYRALMGVCPEGGFRRDRMEVVGRHFIFEVGRFAVVRGTCAAFGQTLFESDRPVSIEYDLCAGKGVVIASRRCRLKLRVGAGTEVRVDGKAIHSEYASGKELAAFTLPSGRHAIEASPIPAGDGLAVEMREGLARVQTLEEQGWLVRRGDGKGRASLNWQMNAGGEITSLDVGTLRGQEVGIVATSLDGRVYLLNSEGGRLWDYRTADAVYSAVIADVDKDGAGEVVAGSDDRHVYLFGADGQVLWTYEPAFGIQYWPWWTLGASKVRKVYVDDINGDGAAEILAGVANMRLHVLDAHGREKWNLRTDHGVFTTLTTADVDGDGVREIVGGMALKASNSGCLVIGGDGTVRRVFQNQGWTSQLTAVAVAALDGESDRLSVLCGTNRAETLRVFDAADGTFRWGHSLADVVTAIRVVRSDGNDQKMVVAASKSFCVSAFGPDGRVAWVQNLGAPVNALEIADVNGDGLPEVVAGCEDGRIWVLNGRGEKLGWAPGTSGITALWCGVLGARGPAMVLAGSREGALRAWRMEF